MRAGREGHTGDLDLIVDLDIFEDLKGAFDLDILADSDWDLVGLILDILILFLNPLRYQPRHGACLHDDNRLFHRLPVEVFTSFDLGSPFSALARLDLRLDLCVRADRLLHCHQLERQRRLSRQLQDHHTLQLHARKRFVCIVQSM